ncbi:Hpt domain-containing protein [Pirellulaceae bacterium SH449]
MNKSNEYKIHSLFATDEDFTDLLREFVHSLPYRQQSLTDCLENRDLERLTRIIHQLKGACGGYGFPSLTDAARALEEQLRAGVELSELREQILRFADLLSLVTTDPAPTAG